MLLTIALFIGYMMDRIFGDPQKIPHPICWIGNLISRTEKYLRSKTEDDSQSLISAGRMLVFVVTLISTLIPVLLVMIAYLIHPIFFLVVQTLMFFQLIAVKSLRKESMKVYDELMRNDLEQSRYMLSMIVGRDTKNLNQKQIVKATVETIAESTSDGVVAPMFYMTIGGAPFTYFYKSINTMDSMVGYKNDKYLYFGRAAAKLDDIVNYIPSRIAAISMIIASFVLSYDHKNAWKIYKRDKRNHASPNSAQTESVCAGALNVMLAGNATYFGKVYQKPTIGDNNREIEIEDIKRANRLMTATSVVSVSFFLIIRALIFLMLG